MPASFSRRAVDSSDLWLKSTPTIVSGCCASARPRAVWSRMYSYSVRSSRPSPQPMSTMYEGCSASGSPSNVEYRCTRAMSLKYFWCMKPLASTFIVRSTCSSCPSASCVKTVATSPKSTVSSCSSIGR